MFPYSTHVREPYGKLRFPHPLLRIADRFVCLPGAGEADRLVVRDVAGTCVRRGPVQRRGFDIPRLLELDLKFEMPVLDAEKLLGTQRRSEERRVGKEWVSTCRSRCVPSH